MENLELYLQISREYLTSDIPETFLRPFIVEIKLSFIYFVHWLAWELPQTILCATIQGHTLYSHKVHNLVNKQEMKQNMIRREKILERNCYEALSPVDYGAKDDFLESESIAKCPRISVESKCPKPAQEERSSGILI